MEEISVKVQPLLKWVDPLVPYKNRVNFIEKNGTKIMTMFATMLSIPFIPKKRPRLFSRGQNGRFIKNNARVFDTIPNLRYSSTPTRLFRTPRNTVIIFPLPQIYFCRGNSCVARPRWKQGDSR